MTRWIAAAGAFVVSLDSMVNIAFPSMAAAFRLPPEAMRWVIICYVGTYALMSFGGGALPVGDGADVGLAPRGTGGAGGRRRPRLRHRARSRDAGGAARGARPGARGRGGGQRPPPRCRRDGRRSITAS